MAESFDGLVQTFVELEQLDEPVTSLVMRLGFEMEPVKWAAERPIACALTKALRGQAAKAEASMRITCAVEAEVVAPCTRLASPQDPPQLWLRLC